MASASRSGAVAGMILLTLLTVAFSACTADAGEHPRTVGLPYQEALGVIMQWCPTAVVRVEPAGLLQEVTDHDLLFVHAESYRVPARRTPARSEDVPADAPKAPIVPAEPRGAPVRNAADLGAVRLMAPTGPSLGPCDSEVRTTVILRLATRVPSLTDLSVAEARALLDRHGLALQVPEPATDTAVVRSQSPAEGTPIEIDAVPHATSRVTVEIAIPVPNLVDLPETEACRSLQGSGLGCEIVLANGDGPKPGRVTSQDPPPGELVAPGATVTLAVVREQVLVPVPDVTGRTRDQACRLLLEPKLDCRVDGPADPSLAAGVAAQAPAAGVLVPPGSIVTITLAVRVPNVIGLDRDVACTALAEQASLTCRPVELAGAGTPGEVTRQAPAARTTVPVGTTVDVEFARGVRVPDVRDAAGDMACDTIAAAGLTCRTDNRSGGAGVVVEQSPAPDTVVADGTEITLIVQQQRVTGIPLWTWTLVLAAALLVAAGAGVQRYRARHPPQPPPVDVTLRPGSAKVRAAEAREW